MADEKNVVLVFAAGNDNVLASVSPQNRPEWIISVSAVTPEFHRAFFSDFGTGTTVAAPGTSITSLMPGGLYGVMKGTSQAAPIVAGTVALMKSLDRNIKAEEVIAILKDSGTPVQNDGSGPLVNAEKSLQALTSNRSAR